MNDKFGIRRNLKSQSFLSFTGLTQKQEVHILGLAPHSSRRKTSLTPVWRELPQLHCNTIRWNYFRTLYCTNLVKMQYGRTLCVKMISSFKYSPRSNSLKFGWLFITLYSSTSENNSLGCHGKYPCIFRVTSFEKLSVAEFSKQG